MNISATTTVSSLTPTSAASAVAGTVDNQASTQNPAAAGDRTQLTPLGELMSQLQDLESSDPAKAKQVLSSISTALSDKAKAGDAPDSHLQDLADRFAQAAQTGDLSALRPHGGHHHAHAAGQPPPPSNGDVPGANPTYSASYLRGANDRRAEVESIISDALSAAQ
jgi:hypothetical protein